MSLQSNFQYLIYEYISHCYDEFGFLPSEDDIYLRFQVQFDNGIPFEFAEEEIRRFVNIHSLIDIEIRWEGKLFGNHLGRIDKEPEVPHQAAARKS